MAVGRRLAEDVRADADMPPFDRVMMDGFAVHASDTGEGVALPVDGEVAAGAPGDVPLPGGQPVNITAGIKNCYDKGSSQSGPGYSQF